MQSSVLIRFLLTVLCVSILATGVFAQQAGGKPLTQAEFVKVLYDLQKNPNKKDEVIETIRKRGIGFEMTDGLRGLVQSKSGDVELRRTLDEAARRRANPVVAALPSEKEAVEVLAEARKATLAAVEEMPDFVVKQNVGRSYAYAGTNNFISSDRLTIAVSYRAKGGEEYRILTLNGAPQTQEESTSSYMKAGGTTSTGEFVTVLSSIFKPESKTDFAAVDTDTLRGRRTIVYNFSVRLANSEQRITSFGAIANSVITGYRGKIWIDRENFRVLRVEQQATEIPGDFPITAATRNVDYDWVTISKEKYLLPLRSEVRLTARENKILVESRNEIRFGNYQKFGTEIKILDDDEEVVEEPPPKKP